MKPNHIICYDGSSAHGKKPYTVECQHCGALHEPKRLTIPFNVYTADLRRFEKQHRNCPPPGDNA